MKAVILLSLAIFLSGGMNGSGWTFDDARHHFSSNYDGGPYGFGYGRFLLSPYYAYHPREAKKPANPPVYIQRLSVTEQLSAYWHYCSNLKGYYPSVKKCPGGWLPVAPQQAITKR